MALTTQPFAQMPELDDVRAELGRNVQTIERGASIGLGAGLLLYGVTRRSLGGALLALAGAAFIRRGATGHCAVYEKLGINSAPLNTETGVPGDKGIKVVQSIEIRKSPAELYRYWRQLENIPRFMDHVKEVEKLDAERSRWVVRGPMGADVEWQARIVNDREGEMIAWESLPGAQVQNAGSVWFEPTESGAATNVKVSLQYQPPAGVIGAAVAKAFGESPDQQLANDLRRFKEIMESGGAVHRS